MTVPATTNRTSYSGNGSTTAFTFAYPFRATSDLVVTVRTTSTGAESLQTEGTHYTVTGTPTTDAGGYASGTVTFVTAPASGTQVHIDREPARTQTTDYIAGDGIPPSSIEGSLDRLTLLVQDLYSRFSRTLLQPRTAANRDLVLPEPSSSTVSKYLKVNSAGTGYEATGTAPTVSWVHVADYGAVGDGTTDDATAFQAAINALPSGGVVSIGMKHYKIGTALVANQGVLIRGDVRTDLSSNTNGSGSVNRPRITWSGAADATMYTIRPASTGDVVWGGGSENIEWDGAASAATAVHFDNTKYTIFDGKVRNTKVTAIKISSTSGTAGNFAQHNVIRSFEYVWGAASACQNSNGLTIVGNGSTAPGTQHTGGVIFGLVYNGSLVSISENDNCRFDSVHGVVQSGGTGRAIDLLAGGAQDANHNFFQYVVGPVRQGASLQGNTFLHYNSEGGGITQSSGSSIWDGKLHDYGTGNIYRSHGFALRDKICIPSGMIVGESGLSVGNFAAQWPALILSNAGTSSVGVTLPRPYQLHNGVIEGVEVLVGSDGTSAGNYRLQVRAGTWNQVGVATPEVDMTQTSAAGAQYVPALITFTFSSELAFTRNDDIFLRFTRQGADAADTNTDGMYVLGMRILYRSSGPTTAGSGAYTIPSW